MLLLGLGLMPLLIAYLAVPRLVGWLVPLYAHELGFSDLSIAVEYPGLRGIEISEFWLATEDFSLRGHDAGITYSFASLRAKRLLKLEVANAELVIRTTHDGKQTTPEIIRSPAAAKGEGGQPFAGLPIDNAQIENLALVIPEFEFRAEGGVQYDGQRLELSLTGQSPEQAQGLSLLVALDDEGTIVGRLSPAESGAEPFIQLQSALPDEELVVAGMFKLDGFLLEMISAIAGVPAGVGSLSGELEIHYPWPLPEALQWDQVSAAGPLRVDWTSKDDRWALRSVAGDVDLRNGQLSVDWTGMVELAVGDGKATLRPQRLVVVIEPLRWQLQTELDAASDQGRLIGLLHLDVRSDLEGASHDGQIMLEGSIDLLEQRLPLKIDGSGRLNGDRLDAQLALGSNVVEDLAISIDYPLEGGQIQVEFSHQQTITEPLAAGFWPGWDAAYDLDGGNVALSGSVLGRSLESLTGHVMIDLEGAAAHYGDTAIRDLSAQLDIDIDGGRIRLQPTKIGMALVDFGVPLRDLSANVEGSLEQLQVSGFTARLLGGLVSAEPFAYVVEPGQAIAQLRLSNLDLAAILALEGDRVTGVGRLDGSLPLTVSANRFRIDDGLIKARSPGGEIRLSTGIVGALTQPGMDLALGALSNFQYDVLEADVAYSEKGDLSLGVRLQGRNPEIEKGRPIHYNLNVSENVPVLLESLRLQDSFTRRIEKAVLN